MGPVLKPQAVNTRKLARVVCYQNKAARSSGSGYHHIIWPDDFTGFGQVRPDLREVRGGGNVKG
jgi:hypothetical protein